VGFTGQTVKERWRQHVNHSRKGQRHPLYAAIRKYGAATFTVETLETHVEMPSALLAEREHIAATPRAYNVSEGGDMDFVAGVAELKRLLAEDAGWAAKYKAALSAGCKNSDVHKARLPEITAAAGQWRADNPKDAWKTQNRATRAAARENKGKPGKSTQHPGTAEKIGKGVREFWANATPAMLKRKSIQSRKTVTKVWAERTPEAREAVAAKIAASVLEVHANKTPEEVAQHEAQLAQARHAIDRSKQGPAASKGLKQYWADLKADPARYAEHMGKRTASLLKKLEEKKNTPCK
jgi:CRISPR/Cas system-associated exonuclease Cas4 (RecB family)